jgi:ABC-type nitrate/sulfonate/bicarbonate transport system substrate-binding protein
MPNDGLNDKGKEMKMLVRHCRLAMIAMFAGTGIAVASAGAALAQAQAPVTLRYAVDTERNINELSQRVAERQGFFAREGIKLDIHRYVTTGNRERDRTSLVGSRDTFEMARMQLSVLMEPEGRFKGMNYVAVEAVVNNPAYFLVARPEIKSFADLKGKTLTLPSPNDPISLTAHELLKMHGLADADVKIKDIAGSQPRVNCLKSGECAAASLSQPPVFAAFDNGAHTLGMHIETGQHLLYVIEMVNRAWGEMHADVIVRYIRATAAANRFIRDPANGDEVVKAAMEVTGQPENRAREMLAYFWDDKNDVLPRQGEIDLAKVNALMALYGKYGILPAPLPPSERFVDLRYLKMAGIQ